MLRSMPDSEFKDHRTWSISARGFVVVLLLGAAWLATGLRGREAAVASAAPPAAAQGSAPAPAAAPAAQAPALAAAGAEFDLQYVPLDAAFVIAARPAHLLALPGMEPMVAALNNELKLDAQLGFSASELDQFVFSVRIGNAPDQTLLYLHARQTVSWQTLIDHLIPQAAHEPVLGATYYKAAAGAAAPPIGIAQLNDQAVLIGHPALLVQALAEGLNTARQPPWQATWKQNSQAAMVTLVNVEQLRAPFNQELARVGRNSPQAMFISMYAPLVNQVNHVCLATDLAAGLGLNLLANCTSPEAAQNVQATAQALLTLGTNSLPMFKETLLKEMALNHEAETKAFGRAATGTGELAMMGLVFAGAEELARSAKITANGATVRLTAESKLASAPMVAGLLLPAMAQARTAARQAQNSNSLKQLALAMHNYAAAHGHLPAAALPGPNGKTMHSWRVELLPYLEADALYREYRQDEPWDSPANQQVLAKMPAVYRAAGDAPGSTSTPFVVPVGKETIFHSAEGTKFSEVLDGTSMTVMLMTSAVPVPWTKPVDVEIDFSRPKDDLQRGLATTLPVLSGGDTPGMAWALADGSVQYVKSLNWQQFQAMLTRAGGEPPQLGDPRFAPPNLNEVKP